MKSIYKNLLCGLFVSLLFASCEEEDSRVVYPHSTPVIESAEINPASFTYGDSVTITAKVSDPVTPLSTLEMKMIVNDVLVATQVIRTKDNSDEVSAKFKVLYASELPDNANVEVRLTLINVEGDKTLGSIEGLTGKRTYHDKLFLVLDDGSVITLKPDGTKSDKYLSPEIKLKSNKIRYKIAEKITAENQVDFSGYVWGLRGGSIQLIDETGDYITTTNTDIDYVTQATFDTYGFKTTIVGAKLNPNDLLLDNFGDATVDNEAFKTLSRSFEKNQEVSLFDDLADANIVYDMNYFERIAGDKIKFVGETGSYTMYYSATRKFAILDPTDRAYPNVLLAAGQGLGHPSKLKPGATTKWDFNAPMQCIVFRKVGADVYQGIVYVDAATTTNFKFFENRSWANEKKSTDYTMPALLAKDSDVGKTDGNWYIAAGAKSGNYKITVNLATKVVTAESVTLP